MQQIADKSQRACRSTARAARRLKIEWLGEDEEVRRPHIKLGGRDFWRFAAERYPEILRRDHRDRRRGDGVVAEDEDLFPSLVHRDRRRGDGRGLSVEVARRRMRHVRLAP